MALLGKISAVITANATDFTRKIGDVKSELNALQKRVQGYRLNLETSALDKTLTKLQLFRRTLQEAVGKKIDVGPLQDLYKAVEDIGKPLTQVKNQIESLSNSTQAYLYPALERAQKGFQNLFNEIRSGATTFDAQSSKIASLTRQIERLKASTAVVQEFSRATASLGVDKAGATFVQPRALEELKRAVALRNKAAELPAGAKEDPFFQGLVRDAAVASERIEALVAKIERAKLRAAGAESVIARNTAAGRPVPSAALNAAAAAAEDQARTQAQLDREVDAQRIRNQRLSAVTSLADVGSMRAPAAANEVEKAAANAARAIEALRAADPNLEPYAEQLRAMAEAASKASGETQRLAAALELAAKADAGQRLASAADAINKINDSARRGVNSLKTDADRRREVFREARDAGVSRDEITGARRRSFLDREIGGRAESLQRTISGLGDGLSSDLQRRLDAAKSSLDRLVNTKATPLQTEINKLRREVEGLESDTARASKQQSLLNEFDASTAMNLQPRAVKDYINDFQLLLNLAGNLNEEAGTNFAASLERSKARIRGLAEEIAKIKLGPATAESAAQVERLLQQIRRESKSLASELASLDPTRFNEKQLNKLLSANRRLRGDISGLRGSAMAGQLALQQLTFAVDDFFSATGNLEYKLRAVSNNISQLGFVLGNTKGLVAAVAATVGAQLLIQFGGIGKASREAEGALKVMNDELEKSRNLADQTTKAFEDLAKALRGSAVGGPRGDIEERVRSIREDQKNAREADVRGRDPAFSQASGRRQALEDELKSATRIGDRVRIRAEIEAARRAERDAGRDVMRPRPLGDVQALLERSRQSEIATLERPRNERENRRLEELRRERITRPASAEDAAAQIRARLTELNKTQGNTPFEVRLLADILPNSMEGGPVAAFTETDRIIGELDAELARLNAVIKEGSDDLVARFAELGLVTKEEIAGVSKDLAALRLDADARSGFEARLRGPAEELGNAIKEIEKARKEDPQADISALEKRANDAAAALEALYREADKIARDAALGSLVPTANRLASAASIAGGVGGPTVAGSNAARFAADLQDAENRRRRAELRGDSAGTAAIDKEIESIRRLTPEVEKAAIAVAAFQRAAQEAALNLSRTLVSEAQSDAERMRRRANRLDSDPLMRDSAIREREAAERRRREQEDSDRQLQREVESERLKFEREKAGTGRVADLAEQVRAGRAAQENRTLPVADQLAGKQRADEAEAQLKRELESRLKPFVDAANARDAARQKELEDIRKANERTAGRAGATRSILGDNTQMAGRIGDDAVKAAADLAFAMEETRKKIEEAASAGVAIPDALKDELERLAAEVEAQRQDFVRRATEVAQNRGGGFEAQSRRAREELDRAGVFASDVQGQLTALETERASLEQKRRAFQDQNMGDEAATVQRDIDALDAHAEKLNAAAIAVAAFQEAANAAALSLQKQVESDSRGAADSARRRANEAEAIFGERSPQAREARAEADRREKAARRAEDERARADKAIAQERAKFEQEIATGANPAAAARAEKIRQLEQDAADERKTAAEQEAARAEADRLRREQEREFQNRPEVQAERRKADEADAELARQNSAARGRELMKTERQRAEEAVKASAGDIANAVNQMRDEGVGRRQLQQGAQNAANNLARQAAPLLAGFAEEVANARLSGPSRAALNATDIQTTEGAKELNRLLRGDDEAKNVNLVELRKQVQLLEAIEKAILDQANVVVDL